MITSTANERIKWVSKLQTKKKERDLQDVFVTEGMRMLKEVPKERLVSCFCTESFLRQYAWIEDTANRLEHGLEVVSDKVFDKITDTKTPQGVLAVVKREHFDLDDYINDKSLFVILENKKMEELGEKVKFSFWEKYDDSHTVIRIATSWATTKEHTDALIELLKMNRA